MKKFKMRCDCKPDADLFIECLSGFIQEHKITPDIGGLPDVELEITTSFTKKELIEILCILDDCHVMADTIEEESKYTGKRKYKY